MSGFTKAPWRFEVDEDGDKHIRDAKGQSLMCNTQFYPWVDLGDEDWKLVAAAPELYRALEALDSSWLKTFPDGPDGEYNGVQPGDEHKAIWAAARAALADAKGIMEAAIRLRSQTTLNP